MIALIIYITIVAVCLIFLIHSGVNCILTEISNLSRRQELYFKKNDCSKTFTEKGLLNLNMISSTLFDGLYPSPSDDSLDTGKSRSNE